MVGGRRRRRPLSVLLYCMIDNQQEILDSLGNFLARSDAKFSKVRERQHRDMKLFSGASIYDDDAIRKRLPRKRKKVEINVQKSPVLASAILSPILQSNWHTALQGTDDDAWQERLDDLQNSLGYKNTTMQAAKRGVACGEGFVVFGFDDDDRPIVEFVNDQSMVAFDPECLTASGEDAEEGATIRYISKRKAERVYGIDAVWGRVKVTSSTSWQSKDQDRIPVVNYYRLESDGCHLYKVVGDDVVADIPLRIDKVPIVRFAAWENVTEDTLGYTGIVSRTLDAQILESIAYSTLADRLATSIKAHLAISAEALAGHTDELARTESGESMAIVFNQAGGVPQVVAEQIQTADLQGVIASCRQLQEDVVGIPLTGVPESDKTATEVMVQNQAQQSNAAEVYMHYSIAMHHLGDIMVQAVCGSRIPFVLEAGPEVITTQMKQRQTIGIVAAQLQTSPVAAYFTAKSMSGSVGERLAATIRANNPDVLFVDSDDEPDMLGYLAQELQKAKNIGGQAIAEAKSMNERMVELEQRNRELELQVSNAESAQVIDLEKFKQELALKWAALEQKAEVDRAKAETEAAKAVATAEKMADDTAIKANELREEIIEKQAEVAEGMGDGGYEGQQVQI